MDKSFEPSLYEWIEEIENSRENRSYKPALQELQALQDGVSICNKANNSVTHPKESALQERYKQDQGGEFPESWDNPLSPSLPPVQVQDDPVTLEDKLMELYTDRLENIASKYPDCCQEWLMQAKPDLYRSLCAAYNGVDEVWKSALAGGATVADFEHAVNVWYDLQIECIRLYRASLPKPDNKLVAVVNKSVTSVCPACGVSKWWLSVHNVKVCGVCHPPGAEKLVKEWINQRGEK